MELIALALVMFSLGALVGHAAGYARRGDVEHARRMAAVNGGPRYVRSSDVGAAE